MLRGIALSLVLPILAFATNAAWAQEPATRVEADRLQREQKAKTLKPY